MSIRIPKLKLAYFPVPKVACTSLKKACFELENGFPFKDFWVNGTLRHIHNIYESRPLRVEFQSSVNDFSHRICLVRDPIKRVLSCYSNRVVFHRELVKWALPPAALTAGLKPNPTLHEFIEHFELYRSVSVSIAHHTEPMTTFLGVDPKLYTRIYRFEEISEIGELFSALNGGPIRISHEQSEGPKFDPQDLSSHETNKIRAFYASDYDLFGEWL